MEDSIIISTKMAFLAYGIVIVISLLVAALIKVIALSLGGKVTKTKPAPKTVA